MVNEKLKKLIRKKNKIYYGTVYLSHKGKKYGAFRKQIGAKSVSDARKQFKKRYSFKSDGVLNVVTVKEIISRVKAKATGEVY